jgi:hypothetical protein
MAGEIGKVTRIWSDTVGFSRMHGVTRWVGSAERSARGGWIWLDLVGLAWTDLDGVFRARARRLSLIKARTLGSARIAVFIYLVLRMAIAISEAERAQRGGLVSRRKSFRAFGYYAGSDVISFTRVKL